MKVKAFRPLRFKVTPYSIVAEDLDGTIRWVCDDTLGTVITRDRMNQLVDKLYEEITLMLTEDIDFEA